MYATQILVLKSGGPLDWETQSEWTTEAQADAATSHHNEIGDTARTIELEETEEA